MKIGILQCGHAPDEIRKTAGDYDAMFATLLDGNGFEFHTFNVVDMQFPDAPDAMDGWIVSGSRHGAYEDHAFIPPLEDLIRTLYATKSPMIGVCFGHQIIAQALGGQVEKFAGGWSVGHTTYTTPDGDIALNAWHQDQVTTLPDDARVLASSDFCKNAILAYGDTVWTVQAHPEFDAPIIDGLIQYRGRGTVPDPLLRTAQNDLNAPTDRQKIGTQMATFFLRHKAEAAA